MKFKQSAVAQPVRHTMTFQLMEVGKKPTFVRPHHNDFDSIILSDADNTRMFVEILEKSVQKMGLKVKNGCDTILTVTYYERNGRVLAVKLLVANYIKKGEIV